MIKNMRLISIIAGLFFLVSCNQHSSKENIKSIETKKIGFQKEIKFKSKIDSVSVHYWKSTEANEYSYKYVDRELAIKGQYFGVNIKSSDTTTIDKFITFVNEFYIDKTEKIILEKIKRDYVVSSEYPSITVIGYKGGKELFREHTQIGYEEYDVKFNPKFLEFYEFLDDLIATK